MSYNAWMPVNNTTGKSYDYTTKKNQKTSQKDDRKERAQEKESDKIWKFPTESYVPSTQAEEYKTKKTASEKAGTKSGVKLSEKAQKLLEELTKKYSNMDFFVASYSSNAEAQRYLRQGTKEYSVLIDPETLEEMANDETVRKQYEDILSGAGDKLAELKEQLGEDADQVKSFGISINKEGKVSYFAELDKISESRNKQLERSKEKKAEEKKEAKRKEKVKEQRERYFVEADSIGELAEKIKDAAAEQTEEDSPAVGFDIRM